LRYWLDEQERQQWIEQYREGYRRQPETANEVAAAEASAIPLLTDEPW
jgi:hypothetical protein